MSDMFVSAAHRSVILPYRQDLMNLMPHAKTLVYQGQRMIAVPHEIDAARLMRNLNIPVPAPVLNQYVWPGDKTPFLAQQLTVALLTMNKRAYVLNSFGSGKTAAALWAFDWLREIGEAHKLLVVAPLSTLNVTWAREVFETVPHLDAVVLHGSAKRRQRLLAEQHDIYIINHDGLRVLSDALSARPDIDCVVLDELAVYRHARTNRTRIAAYVTRTRKFLWGMTGAPTPTEPLDAWAQARLITPHTVPKYYGRFREMTMTKINQFKWIARHDANDVVHKALQPSVRYTLDDVQELPNLVVRTQDVAMSPMQVQVYDRLMKHFIAVVGTNTIDAINEAALRTKLLQVSLGWVYTGTRGIVDLGATERMQALVDLVDANERKVIVFVPYLHAMAAIADHLRTAGHDLRVVSGATSVRERAETFNLFQNTSQVKVLVAHPGTAAHGLTLTAADTVIWAGPLDNLELYDQANARITRVGQQHRQSVVLLQGSKIERVVYQRLRAKQAMQGALMTMIANQEKPT